jgi:excisionase family DNA binding protein
MADEFMTTREAARYLDLSITVLTRKARRGELGAVKRGNGWVFPKSQIEAYARAVAGKSLNDPTRGDDLRQ